MLDIYGKTLLSNKYTIRIIIFETLKGEGPKIKFKDFTFEIIDKKIRVFINIEDMKQYNPKKEIKELNEIYTLFENELGLD